MLSLRPLLLSEISWDPLFQTMTIRAYIVWTMYEVFGLNNGFSFANARSSIS